MTQTPEIVQAVINYITNNLIKINSIYSLKGGWEGWLQTELALEFKALQTVQIALREEQIYESDNQLKVDIYIKLTDQTNHYVELKCQGWYQTEEWNVKFAPKVNKDLLKISSNIKQKYLPGTMYAISIWGDINAAIKFLTKTSYNLQIAKIGNSDYPEWIILWYSQVANVNNF